MSPAPGDSEPLTIWLRRMRDGDPDAAEHVANSVYAELRRLAAAVIAHEHRHHSLQPTLLVNEAFVRLLHGQPVDWQDRHHFYALAARKMRQIIVDYFRHKDAAKQPPDRLRVDLEEILSGLDARQDEVLIVDQALDELARFDSRAAQVVEMRYFGGRTLEEIAEILRLDPRTIKRDWVDARAWLRQFLAPPGPPPESRP